MALVLPTITINVFYVGRVNREGTWHISCVGDEVMIGQVCPSMRTVGVVKLRYLP